MFTGLGSDTDCDGTTFHAKRFKTMDEAHRTSDIYKVMPESEFLASDQYLNLTTWEKAYYLTEGYCSLGAKWNSWVEDDTIGTVLDSRYDDPIYTDDDILQMQYERGW